MNRRAAGHGLEEQIGSVRRDIPHLAFYVDEPVGAQMGVADDVAGMKQCARGSGQVHVGYLWKLKTLAPAAQSLDPVPAYARHPLERIGGFALRDAAPVITASPS
ncbi:hypothetical protein [Paraburkholderia sp. GAS334]|uniref:hypothetical protein n=1 Tax=Paraburkholderia sp. GAS334 TaxID=3035131 RepID=UPI003D249841